MTIVEKVVKKATHKGKTIEFTYVKLDDGKWYRLVPTFGYGYLLKEIKK